MLETETIWPGEDWQSAAPAALDLSETHLHAAAQTLGRSGSNARAFLVIRHGCVAWEAYFAGSGPRDRHHLFSVTKSFTSALVGMALADGSLGSLARPVLDFFPEYAAHAASGWEGVNVRQLLSMSSGMMWRTGVRGSEPMAERMRHRGDWVEFILSVPVRREDAGRFHYNSGGSHLLAAIVARATGENVCAYANRRLFAPLGIAPVACGSDWEADPRGYSTGGWGLHLNARELARFGWLYLHGGQWAGARLLSEEWVRVCTHPAMSVAAGLAGPNTPGHYGYQWWLRNSAGLDVFAALGLGGQYLFCVPQRDMLVVILSNPMVRWPDRWEVLDALLEGVD